MSAPKTDNPRLDRIEETIARQKDFIRQVPDPDNRELAEANLITLVGMRDELVDADRPSDLA